MDSGYLRFSCVDSRGRSKWLGASHCGNTSTPARQWDDAAMAVLERSLFNDSSPISSGHGFAKHYRKLLQVNIFNDGSNSITETFSAHSLKNSDLVQVVPLSLPDQLL